LGANTYLPDGTASNQLNIGNTIYGDLAMQRIGIGVTSPSTALEVSGTLRVGNGIATSVASIAPFPSGGGFDIHSLGSIGFFANNTRMLQLRPTGLLIGTNLPVSNSAYTALHVSGTIRIADGGEACDANRAGAIKYNSGSFYFCDGATDWKTLGEIASLQSDRITSGTTNVYARADGSISFTTAGVTTGYFYGGQLVANGVSTTGVVSASGLYVGGNSTALNVTRYDGTAGSTGGVARFTLNTSGTFANGTGPALTFSAFTDMGRIGFYSDGYDGTTTSSRLGSFFIQNRILSGAYVTNFVVNSSGFVGVGTTSPTARMDVSGSIKVSGDSSDVCDDTHVGMIRRDPTTGHMQLCQ
jgi:hypothetical protein